MSNQLNFGKFPEISQGLVNSKSEERNSYFLKIENCDIENRNWYLSVRKWKIVDRKWKIV